jgi:hypothetical protein
VRYEGADHETGQVELDPSEEERGMAELSNRLLSMLVDLIRLGHHLRIALRLQVALKNVENPAMWVRFSASDPVSRPGVRRVDRTHVIAKGARTLSRGADDVSDLVVEPARDREVRLIQGRSKLVERGVYERIPGVRVIVKDTDIKSGSKSFGQP